MSSRASACPLEAYKIICEMMRGYAMLRFYRMALLLGTSGGNVTAFASQTERRLPVPGRLDRALTTRAPTPGRALRPR